MSPLGFACRPAGTQWRRSPQKLVQKEQVGVIVRVCVCAEHQIYPDANFSTCRGLEPARGVTSQRRRPPVPGSKRTCRAAPGPLSWQLAGPPQTKVPFLPFSPKPAEPQLYSRLTSCTRTMRDLSVVLETHQLYSRLISCTRDSSVVLERLAPSIRSLSVYTPFVGNPRVYPSCDPGPALSENLTSTCLSYNSGISHLSRNEVSLKGRQPPDHSYVSQVPGSCLLIASMPLNLMFWLRNARVVRACSVCAMLVP